VAVRVPLVPGSFRPDFAAISAAITPRPAPSSSTARTTPAPPFGTRRHAALQDLLAPTNVLLISDEVYEHMV
jgi:methionine aminotransferase